MATKKRSTTKKTTKTAAAKKEDPAVEPATADEAQPVTKPDNRKKILLISLVSLVIIAVFAGGGLLYKAYNDEKQRADKLANPTEAAKEETRQLIEKVGALTELPDEEPTIATVRDKSKLEDQSFFQNAQNGDKVLIFTQAKKAVLYRPSSDKIIEIAPVNLGQDQSSLKGTATETKPKPKSKPAPTKTTD